MLYQKPSFSVPASSGSSAALRAQCEQHGHMDADVRGKCLRCGEFVSAIMDPRNHGELVAAQLTEQALRCYTASARTMERTMDAKAARDANHPTMAQTVASFRTLSSGHRAAHIDLLAKP